MSIQEEEQGKVAFILHEEIKRNEQARRALFIENIEKLLKIQSEKLYQKYLGDENAPWTAYLSEADVFYSRWQIDRWRRILTMAEKFNVDKTTLLEVPETRLEQIASMAENSEEMITMMNQAVILTPKDWNNVIREKKGLPTTENHEHKFSVFEICECGEKHKKD